MKLKKNYICLHLLRSYSVLRLSLKQTPQETLNTNRAKRPREARGKLTKTSFYKVCVICGSTHDLEIHHIRLVKNVRAIFRKVYNISITYFKEALMRKQVPLCLC